MELSSKRLVSLDAFRGMTIVGMIMVNNPGSWKYVYSPLLHAEWHGWTPTDFIFPFFLFIVGVAMAFSFGVRIERGDSHTQLLKKVISRTLKIFLLGLFLNYYWTFDLETVRIPGVLQRIALCYLFASIIMLKMNKRWQIWTTVIILIGYWAALKLIPVPGYGAGLLTAEGSLPWYIDSNLLEGHTWRGAPFPGFDPEGLLSTIPAIASVMLGVFTGDYLRSERSEMEKAAGLFFWGSVAMVAGVAMAIWMPINKNLWTSSYVVFMAGMALSFLAFCYYLIDLKGYKKWAFPFVVFGMNAIIAFFTLSLFGKTLAYWSITQSDGSEISVKSMIYQNLFQPWAGDYFGSLLYPVVMNLIWFGFLYVLYRKKIFIKV
ncbi:MAG: DUF5009 domain-containing protein [candidate division KSB1 bacterium]|jgi:predicted acyltransferase|nr:DUF5009 domain-containing protein [candidate division KSB1 bacterium]